MAWVIITTDDCLDAKAGPLVEALQTAALAEGQSNPLPRIIADVVAQVRAEVASCRENRLDADPAKVPADLKQLTVRMVLWAARARLAVSSRTLEATEQDKIDHEADLALLRRVARCERRVDETDNPEATPTVQAGGAIEAVRPCGPVTSAALDGL